MSIYYPYGLIAIGLSLYFFYMVRRKRKDALNQRRDELKTVRQEWLDHQLGRATSSIILYGEFMEQKIRSLQQLGTNELRRETYFIDKDTGDKWIREYPDAEMHEGATAQLRKVDAFPFD